MRRQPFSSGEQQRESQGICEWVAVIYCLHSIVSPAQDDITHKGAPGCGTDTLQLSCNHLNSQLAALCAAFLCNKSAPLCAVVLTAFVGDFLTAFCTAISTAILCCHLDSLLCSHHDSLWVQTLLQISCAAILTALSCSHLINSCFVASVCSILAPFCADLCAAFLLSHLGSLCVRHSSRPSGSAILRAWCSRNSNFCVQPC